MNHLSVVERLVLVLSIVAFSPGTIADDVDQSVECNLYLAPSTVPDAGLGLFTAVPRAIGESVGDGDKCIPLLDINKHNNGRFFDPFLNYVWRADDMGMQFEVDSSDIRAMCAGVDALANSNLALINIAKMPPHYDDARMHRDWNPGAGAISPYCNSTSKVTRAIPAGGELFHDYGDDWFEFRDNLFHAHPLSVDISIAQVLLEMFDSINTTASVKEDLYNVLLDIRSRWDTRKLNALPSTYEDARLAINVDIQETHQKDAIRSVDWLREHGKCVDHITYGPSSLDNDDENDFVNGPGVGHGAFAKRDLPKGTIITGSPLHHIPDRDAFLMYEFEELANSDAKRTDNITGLQVYVNYCFGHWDSSLLLCPYGSGVNHINHHPEHANVKIQWAKNGTTNHDDSWLQMAPLPDMLFDWGPHLAFDYVATKDIKEGDELFLHYGEDWETAWMAYEDLWLRQPKGKEPYLNAHRWNEFMEDSPVRTEKEETFDLYPKTLQIRCHSALVDFDSEDLVNRTEWEWGPSEKGYPCRVIVRNGSDESSYYTVQIKGQRRGRWNRKQFFPANILRTSVPRQALRFFDLPYTTDLHLPLPKVFRHHIGIPDEIFPKVWRNRVEQEDSDRDWNDEF